MAFAEHKAVTVVQIFIFRAYIHLFHIQLHQNLHDAHVAPDMPALSRDNHIHHMFSQVIRKDLKFVIFSSFSTLPTS